MIAIPDNCCASMSRFRIFSNAIGRLTGLVVAAREIGYIVGFSIDKLVLRARLKVNHVDLSFSRLTGEPIYIARKVAVTDPCAR